VQTLWFDFRVNRWPTSGQAGASIALTGEQVCKGYVMCLPPLGDRGPQAVGLENIAGAFVNENPAGRS
jgi:hypothetical protein